MESHLTGWSFVFSQTICSILHYSTNLYGGTLKPALFYLAGTPPNAESENTSLNFFFINTVKREKFKILNISSGLSLLSKANVYVQHKAGQILN